jgi:hypothetical protein
MGASFRARGARQGDPSAAMHEHENERASRLASRSTVEQRRGLADRRDETSWNPVHCGASCCGEGVALSGLLRVDEATSGVRGQERIVAVRRRVVRRSPAIDRT